ncbi:MAG TPA: hypothetical protein PK431_16580 [Chitinophagales bacterium]|nr:hypothetical protein [Chitinophagales bacterium]
MFNFIRKKISAYILKKTTENKTIDIVEVRTQEIGLTSVITETDIKITNSFFLTITILSIETKLLNRNGIEIGSMNYHQQQKLKGKSELILTATSKISIITSIFQAISQLLAHPIKMRSVGVSKIKILWFTIEIPVDDYFEIHPSKVKITKDLTEEEKAERAIKQKERAEKQALDKAIRKEKILQRRHGENYISKEERIAMNDKDIELDNEKINIVLDENVIDQIPEIDNISITENSIIEIKKEASDDVLLS